MKAYKLKRKKLLVKKLNNIYCNKCGLKIKKTSTGGFYDYLDINKKWGYLSKCDGEIHDFQLCEKCYKKIIDDFVIPIKKK